MSRVQYICPQCKKLTSKAMVYESDTGKAEHKCTRCKKINIIHIAGYMVWHPSVTSVMPK